MLCRVSKTHKLKQITAEAVTPPASKRKSTPDTNHIKRMYTKSKRRKMCGDKTEVSFKTIISDDDDDTQPEDGSDDDEVWEADSIKRRPKLARTKRLKKFAVVKNSDGEINGVEEEL